MTVCIGFHTHEYDEYFRQRHVSNMALKKTLIIVNMVTFSSWAFTITVIFIKVMKIKYIRNVFFNVSVLHF